MSWKQLEFKDRWAIITGGLQAAATLGMFAVALISIWKVTPIITYQVEQQASKLKVKPVSDPFVSDALDWWTEQKNSYDRIAELTEGSTRKGRKVSFEIVPEGAAAIATGIKPDLLIVTSNGTTGNKEVVAVAVNKHAMSPSQYLRLKVNHGAFAELPEDDKRKLETAVESYIVRHMLPRVPPINVRPDMTPEQLREEVTMNQHHREEALRHIMGLDEVLSSVRRSQ